MKLGLGSLLLATFVHLSCGGNESPSKADPIYEAQGPHAVGNATLTLTDTGRNRSLTVEVWYPHSGSGATGEPVENFVVDLENRATYQDLLRDAPTGCPSTETHSSRDALPQSGALPLLVFSHCHNCARFSSFAIAERLASHGFVVAAPDHAGNTLFDDLADEGAELNSEFLRVRSADISFVIDGMLAGELGITVDPSRIGVYGHSFGAVTAGLVLQDDPRPIAGFAIASPMDNPLLTGVEIENITDPIGFLVAVEDNSITELGNVFIRQNFDDVGSPAWKGEVADAGHWSFSDVCAVHPQFAACCGAGERQTNTEPFTYLALETANSIAASYVTAFFAAYVLADDNARRYLGEDRFSGLVEIAEHEATQ